MPRQTPTARRQYEELFIRWVDVEKAFSDPGTVARVLPGGWEGIDVSAAPGSVRITLRVDADVAKFFRRLGPGYQGAMNEVLRCFMLARLSDVLPLPDEGPQIEPLTEGARDALASEMRLRRMADDLRAERLRLPARLRPGRPEPPP